MAKKIKVNDNKRKYPFKKIWEDPKEFGDKVLEFIAECDSGERKATIAGLALFLGLGSRQALINYGNRPEYSDAVEHVKTYITSRHEERLYEQGCAGSIFYMKAMDGWREKDVEEEQPKAQKVVIEIEDSRKK